MEHPSATIPVVVERLKQKDKEWLIIKEKWTPNWARAYRDNYHKSLDHEGFFWKSEQKRNLNPRNIIREAKRRFDEREPSGMIFDFVDL